MQEKQLSKEQFSKRLYKALKNKNLEKLTYKRLGKIFNTSEMAVHKWLNAKSIPTLARMPFIAKKLDVSVEYLLADVTTDKNNKNIKLINKYQALSPNKQKIISDLIDELL